MKGLDRVRDAMRSAGLIWIVLALGTFPFALSANVPILPLMDGFTFARATLDGNTHVLAVLSDDGETVRAVDLTARLGASADSPLEVLGQLGAEALRREIESVSGVGAEVEVARSALVTPVDLARQSVAIAVNYPSHAVEAGEAPEAPFAFPKLSNAQPWDADINAGDRQLLDYEIEVGVVPAAPIRQLSDLDVTPLGFVLANDLTDRDTIVRDSYPESLRTQKGVAAVTSSKSGEDMLQLGPYLVVPDDWRAFMRRVELRLDVNSEVRQRDVPSAMAEGVAALAERVLEANANTYVYDLREVALLPAAGWTPETLLLTGTPSGTSFRAPDSVPEGATLSEVQTEAAVDAWAEREATSGRYLRPGDAVAASGTFLGTLQLTIE